MEDTLWILVADEHRARLFGGDAELTDGMDHLQDITPGRHERPQGSQTEAPFTSEATQQAAEFALELAHFLATARSRRAFDALVVIAPARMLHLLHERLHQDVLNVLTDELQRDCTADDPLEIEKLVRGRVWGGLR